jgi:hypothetical protein
MENLLGRKRGEDAPRLVKYRIQELPCPWIPFGSHTSRIRKAERGPI